MVPEKGAQKLLPGSMMGIILKLLSDNGRMYGYEITKAVREKTAGRLALTEAALYPALHRLLGEGILETETEVIDGRPRKYYRIAAKKQEASTDLLQSLRESLNVLQNLLGDYGISKT